jgi:fatty acid CoA ligase FadD21
VNSTEQLVTIIELKKQRDSTEDPTRWLSELKSDVTSAISNAHGLNIGDLVLVEAGAIPTTTSGKIRRAACVEQYREEQFNRLDI